MSATESGREPGDRTPVFVDASGRRRRGVLVLGYLGASAATVYMAAFGLTVGTRTVSLQPVGATLTPSPALTNDDGNDDAPDEPELMPASTHTATAVTRHAAPGSERATGRHARTEHPRATSRDHSAPLVPLRVVRAPQRVVHTTTTSTVVRESPRKTTPHTTSGRHSTHRATSHAAGQTTTGATTADPATADVLDSGPPSTSTRV